MRTAETLRHLELDPSMRERKQVERKIKQMRHKVLSRSQVLEGLDPPHSPLLARRPVTAGSPLRPHHAGSMGSPLGSPLGSTQLFRKTVTAGS